MVLCSDCDAVVLDEEAIRSLFHNNMRLEPDELEFCSFLNMIIETDAGSSVCNVQGNTKNLTDFHRCSAVEGKEISAIQERKNTFVIKAGGSLDRKGVKTGDTLKINGHTFHVVGVVDYSTYGEIYLPYDTFALIADESSGNLDEENTKNVMELLTGLNEKGMGIILVTHDPYAASFAKRKYVLEHGVLKEERNRN